MLQDQRDNPLSLPPKNTWFKGRPNTTAPITPATPKDTAIRSKDGYTRESLKEKIKQEGSGEEWIHAGLKCKILRPFDDYWCGYVTVPQDNPFYKDLSNDDDNDDIYGPGEHGELSYAHVNKDGSRTFGFDCSHSWDLSLQKFDFFSTGIKQYPFNQSPVIQNDDNGASRISELTYYTKEQVIQETNELAEYLVKYTGRK